MCVLLLDRRLVYANGGKGISSGIEDSTVAMYSSSDGSAGGRDNGCSCGRSSDVDRVGGGCGTCLATGDGAAAAVLFSRSIVPVSSAVPVAAG